AAGVGNKRGSVEKETAEVGLWRANSSAKPTTGEFGSAWKAGIQLVIVILISASGARARISGKHARAAKLRRRASRVLGSQSGSARTSQPNQHGIGTMLDAVPPSMRVTCRLVQGGSKRLSGGLPLSSASMRSSSAKS